MDSYILAAHIRFVSSKWYIIFAPDCFISASYVTCDCDFKMDRIEGLTNGREEKSNVYWSIRYLHVLAKSRAVGITPCPGISKCFKNGVCFSDIHRVWFCPTQKIDYMFSSFCLSRTSNACNQYRLLLPEHFQIFERFVCLKQKIDI